MTTLRNKFISKATYRFFWNWNKSIEYPRLPAIYISKIFLELHNCPHTIKISMESYGTI